MGNTPQSLRESFLVRIEEWFANSGFYEQLRPANAATVDVVGRDFISLEKLGEPRRPPECCGQILKPTDEQRSTLAKPLADVLQHRSRATRSIMIVQPAGRCVNPCSTCCSRDTDGSVKSSR